MSMFKYILIEDFNKLTHAIKQNVVSKIAEEENIKIKDIEVSILIAKKSKFVNLAKHDVSAVILSEKQPEVYHFKPRLKENNLKDANTVIHHHVRIVINVFSVVCLSNVLNLPEDKHTFNRYEDYLEFFTGKYKNVTESNHCTVQTVVNDARVGLATILTDVVETTCDVDRPLTNSDFTSLERYRTLPVSVQQKVDELTCPLVIENEAVFIDRLHGAVNIQLDKHDILEHVRCTDKFSGEINKLINDLPVR